MTFAGMTDSLAGVLTEPPVCARCHCAARVQGGECLSCLLRAGMDPDEEADGDSFEAVLAEIEIHDRDWKLGNYHILEEIGRGGMGVIYRARQRHSRRIVALKRVLSYHGDSRDTLERFRREAEAAASLDHPNILPIYEVGEAEGLPFFTMKYASGGTLQHAAPALRRAPRDDVRLIAKVTRAVAYAHGEGILHRDLKPGNILLDGRGEPLVSDFGLAKWIDTASDLTRSLAIFGTPGFIAPEQAQGDRRTLSAAADVYSLGAILFELLGGRPPFLGEHALAVIRQAADKPAPKLRSVLPAADRDLETICAKCLERDANARYSSAEALADDLERWLEGRPIVARPVSAPTEGWRWAKRNPVVAATGAVCLVLAATVGLSQVQSRVAARAEALTLHTIAVEPLIDLDAAELDTDGGSSLVAELQQEFSSLGQGKVVAAAGRAQLGGDSQLTPAPATPSSPRTRAVLRGTKRMVDGRLRVSLRLLNQANSKLLYRRVFEADTKENVADIAAAEVGPAIYRILDARTLSGTSANEDDPGWRNPAARELLRAGKTVADRRTTLDQDRAIDMYRQAIAAEPRSVLAYCRLAETQAGRGFISADPAFLHGAEQSAKAALALAPEDARARGALAIARFAQGRFKEALHEAFIACELADAVEPLFGMKMANSLKTLGRPDRAIAWIHFAADGRMRPGWNEVLLGDCLADLAANEEAEAAYRRFASLFPELPEKWMGLCRLALVEGDFESARKIASENWQHYRDYTFSQQMAAQVEFFSRNFAEAERLYRELAAKEPDGGGSFYGALSYRSALGRMRFDQDHAAAIALLEEARNHEKRLLEMSAEHPEALYRLAAIEASLGDESAALNHLEGAFNAGWIDYRSLKLDPRFDHLRAHPRFAQLLGEVEQRVAALREQHLRKSKR